MPAVKAKPGRPKKSAAPKRAAPRASLADALGQAAWAEADSALAEALALCDEAISGATDVDQAALLDLLSQSLARAARKRGFTRLGALGAKEAFDRKRHDFTNPPKRTPKTVRIVARGVARAGETLVKTRVGPVRRTGKK
ncbi:MAG: hypothetical protein J0L81_03085 [Caulobacterales bacterium]|nr:hypothetical protein [Caulobacterales bacterium]